MDAPTRPLVLATVPLSMQWPTLDPFLFCAHHDDDYPEGDGALGPAASLGGRAIGQDFSDKDGWSMYHGSTIPGFPHTHTAASKPSRTVATGTSTTQTPWAPPPVSAAAMFNG